LDYQKQCPPVEESEQRAIGFPQIDILATGARHGGGQFSIRERRNHRQNRCNQPWDNQQPGRINLARNIGRDNENARSDHRTDDQRCGVQ